MLVSLTPICREHWQHARIDYEMGATSRAEFEALELMLVRLSAPAPPVQTPAPPVARFGR
jgi:hypothetical protein